MLAANVLHVWLYLQNKALICKKMVIRERGIQNA